jgi:hypothetical protein
MKNHVKNRFIFSKQSTKISEIASTSQKLDTFIANCPKIILFLKKALHIHHNQNISPVYAIKTTYLKLDTCPKSVKKVSNYFFTPVQFCPINLDTTIVILLELNHSANQTTQMQMSKFDKPHTILIIVVAYLPILY